MVDEVMLEGLAAVQPGPELAMSLAELELARVPGDGVVEVLRAQARQSAHEQARLWAALLEVGLAVPGAGSGRAAEVGEWAPGEVAAALTWTARTAERELRLAEVVVRALPGVFAELWAGRIDRGKAVVFAEYLDPAYGVSGEQAAAVLGTLLPVASALTTGQLRARLWRALLSVDPGWARRRYVRAVRRRAVTAVLADDGTVTITGSGLPADEAAVACARVDRLAEAVKRAGHPGRVGRIAADVFLGLLDGRFHALREDQIIAALLAGGRPEDTDPDAARPDDARPDDARPDDARPDDRPVLVGVEIRVGLTTLLGLDDRPGEVPGLGPVIADVARTLVARQRHGAEWRFAVTDTDGHLLLAGVTRRRPRTLTGPGSGAPAEETAGRCRGGIVEVQIPAAQLARLAEHTAHAARAGSCGSGADDVAGHDAGDAVGNDGGRPAEWAAVIADITAQFANRHTLLAALDDHPYDRFPGSALARHIQVRDRTCSHPGCLRPARRSDLDHTRGHARGGTTVRANLGPGCRRHHLFKHELGWQLEQPQPGVFVWTSPMRQVYRTRGEPITPPLPDRLPRPAEPDPADTGWGWADGPILRLPDPSARAETPRPPPRQPTGPTGPTGHRCDPSP